MGNDYEFLRSRLSELDQAGPEEQATMDYLRKQFAQMRGPAAVAPAVQMDPEQPGMPGQAPLSFGGMDLDAHAESIREQAQRVFQGEKAPRGTVPENASKQEEGNTKTDTNTRVVAPTAEDMLNANIAREMGTDPWWKEQLASQVEQQRIALEAYEKRPNEWDLSGLMGLGDIMSNGKYNLRAGYKPPQEDQQRGYLTMRLREGVIDRLAKPYTLDEKTKNQLFLAGQGKDVTESGSKFNAEISRDNKSPSLRTVIATDKNPANFGKLVSTAQNDPEVKELKKSLPMMDKALALLRSGTPVGDKLVIPPILRALGDDRISNYDKTDVRQRLGGLGDRFDNLMEEWSTGTITAKNRDLFLQAITAIRASQTEKWNARRAELRQLGPGFNLTPEQSDRAIHGTMGAEDLQPQKSKIEMLLEKALEKRMQGTGQ